MRRKAVFAAVLATLVLAVVTVTVLVAINTRMEQRDSLTVYCLAPARSEPLTSAGVALGLSVPDDLPRWRTENPTDFWRACEALSAARQAPGAGVFASVLPILTAVLAAVLAFAAATWRDRVTQGRELAAELRDKAAAYHRVAREHLDDWKPNQRDTEVAAARAALEGPLARVRAAHPDWPPVVAVTAVLAGSGQQAADSAAIDAVRDHVFRIAQVVERPVRATVVGAG